MDWALFTGGQKGPYSSLHSLFSSKIFLHCNKERKQCLLCVNTVQVQIAPCFSDSRISGGAVSEAVQMHGV